MWGGVDAGVRRVKGRVPLPSGAGWRCARCLRGMAGIQDGVGTLTGVLKSTGTQYMEEKRELGYGEEKEGEEQILCRITVKGQVHFQVKAWLHVLILLLCY